MCIRDRAYRALARRWHPDRFMQGPERDWANDKMAEINAAYRECLDGSGRAASDERADSERLKQIEQMIDDGKYLDVYKRQLLDRRVEDGLGARGIFAFIKGVEAGVLAFQFDVHDDGSLFPRRYLCEDVYKRQPFLSASCFMSALFLLPIPRWR